MASSDKLVYGSYEVLQNPDGSPWILGEGNFGVTYKAHHAFLGRVSALKVIREDLLNRGSKEDKEESKRFLSEARAVGRLNHPGIASVYDCNLDNGVLYYAMEFCDGGTLQDECDKFGPMAWPAVRVIALQLASALDYAHDSGFLHRDIKPANIMLSGTGKSRQAKLIDFGLAKKLVADIEASAATVRNDQENFRGNFATASPEQILEKELDPRSDLFSFGVTLWWLLIGKNPFGEMKRGPLIADRVGPSSYASSLPAGLDEEARTLLEALLEKDVEKRMPSAHAVVELLTKTSSATAASSAREPDVAGEALPAPPEYEDGYTYGTVLAAGNQAKLYNGKDIITGLPIVAVLPDESLDPDSLACMRIAGYRRMDFGTYAYLDWRLSEGKDLFVLSKPEGCSLLAVLRKFGPARFSDALPFLAHLARCFDASMAWSGFGVRVDPGEILVRTRNGDSDPGKFHSWADLDPHSTRCLPLFSADADHGASNEVTLSTSAEEFPPLAQFAALIYRVLAGSVVKYAAFFTTGGYVMASGLSEDGNALIADTLCDPASHPNAGHFLQLLAGIEALPTGEITPIVAPPTAADIASGKLPLVGPSPNAADAATRTPPSSIPDNSGSVSMKVAELERKLAKARLEAEEEARREAEEEARRKAEEEARRKAEEEARRKAEEEARRKAEEEAKRKAEEEAKRKAEEEAKRKAEEEAKRKAAKEKAEEEAKLKAAAKTKTAPTGKGQQLSEIERQLAELKEEEEEEKKREAAVVAARREAETRRKEEEEAKRKAELESKRLSEEQARLQAEARRKADEEAKAAEKKAAQEKTPHATPPSIPSTPATPSSPPPLTPPVVDAAVAPPAQPQTPSGTGFKLPVTSARFKLIAIAAVLVVVTTAAVIMIPGKDDPKKNQGNNGQGTSNHQQTEKERLAKIAEDKARLAAEQAEKDRLAKIADDKARLAAEQAEKDRLAKIAADKAEQKRKDDEAARLALENAAKNKLYPITIKRSTNSPQGGYRYPSFRVEEVGVNDRRFDEIQAGKAIGANPSSQWKIAILDEKGSDLATVEFAVPDGQKGRPLTIELPGSLPRLRVENPYKNSDYTGIKLTFSGGGAGTRLSMPPNQTTLKIGARDFSSATQLSEQPLPFPLKDRDLVKPFAGKGQWTITYTGSRLPDKTEKPPVSNGEPMADIVLKTPPAFSGHYSIIAPMTPFPIKDDLKPTVEKPKVSQDAELPEIDYFNELFYTTTEDTEKWKKNTFFKTLKKSYGLPHFLAASINLDLKNKEHPDAGSMIVMYTLPEGWFAQASGSLEIKSETATSDSGKGVPPSLTLTMQGDQFGAIDPSNQTISNWISKYTSYVSAGDSGVLDKYLNNSLAAWVSHQNQMLSGKTPVKDGFGLNFDKWKMDRMNTLFRFELAASDDGSIRVRKALQVIEKVDMANGYDKKYEGAAPLGAVLLREDASDPVRKLQPFQ